MSQDKELSKLTKEINVLKKKKERALALSTSYTERNKLMQEIQQLEQAKKSPSTLKSFGKTFFKGLKITSNKLWNATQRGSRNLTRNAPEFQNLAKQKTKTSQPYSPLVISNYLPSAFPIDIDVPRQYNPKKMKRPIGLKRTIKKSKHKVTNPLSWEMP